MTTIHIYLMYTSYLLSPHRLIPTPGLLELEVQFVGIGKFDISRAEGGSFFCKQGGSNFFFFFFFLQTKRRVIFFANQEEFVGRGG